MSIASLVLRNFYCFAGEQSLTLRPQAYGVFARHVSDAQRSNWLGKTTLLEAIVFVLSGEHRHRLEDGWITDGEDSGGVALVTDDGVVVERTRARGKSTKLHFTPAGGAAATGDEAQLLLRQRLGLAEEDRPDGTFYFPQGRTSRFVDQDPGERLKAVSRWFRLGPIEACEARHAERLARLHEQAETIRRGLADADATLKRVAQEAPLGAVETLRADCEKAEAAVSDWQQRLAEGDAARKYVAQGEHLKEVARQGKEARARVDAMVKEDRHARLVTAGEARDEAKAAWSAAAQDAQNKRVVARGEFDGRCPIADIECPAKRQINNRVAVNRKARLAADELEKKCEEEFYRAEKVEREARAAYDEEKREQARLEQLQAEYRRASQATAAAEMPRDVHLLREDVLDSLATARSNASDARAILARYEAAQAVAQRAEAEREKLREGLKLVEDKLQTEREAVLVFRAARQRVAERCLAEVEGDANDKLASSGVDLRASLTWAREGKDPAKACDQCGAAFPASARVKECTRCGAARGKHVVNKLEVSLSNTSGAARDLAGLALQLSAAEWLRRRRGLVWSTLLVDEPFGQLDAAHRGSLARHLAGLLRGGAFSQAIVVAHHADCLEALPGRILVTGDGRRSTVTVS